MKKNKKKLEARCFFCCDVCHDDRRVEYHGWSVGVCSDACAAAAAVRAVPKKATT